MINKIIIGIVVLVSSMLLGAGPSMAEENAPIASVASPQVYKVIAENKEWRVLQGTWQPGQEDNFHSHTADRVSIFPMDCDLRLTKPDGTFKDVHPRAGKAKVRTGKPVAAHKAKNIGNKTCRLLIVELKQQRM